MKNTINLISRKSKVALVLGALTITGALGFSPSAQAAPQGRGPAWGRNDGYRRGPRRDRDVRQTFTGTVTKDRGNNLFNMQLGGKTYNVYTINRTSRRLDKGDLVRVTGRRYGDNDIRNARVEIIRNR